MLSLVLQTSFSGLYGLEPDGMELILVLKESVAQFLYGVLGDIPRIR